MPSPTAEEYSVTIKCEDTYITINETVYNSSYVYNYDQSTKGLCEITIGATNPAGISVSTVTKQLAKGMGQYRV